MVGTSEKTINHNQQPRLITTIFRNIQLMTRTQTFVSNGQKSIVTINIREQNVHSAHFICTMHSPTGSPNKRIVPAPAQTTACVS